jgi:hypothetical protein
MRGNEPFESPRGVLRAGRADHERGERRRDGQTVPTSFVQRDGQVAVDLHDRVIGHLHGARLTLASILSLGTVDPNVAERLRDVMDELGIAARDIRRTDRARLVRRSGRTHHLTIVEPASDR